MRLFTHWLPVLAALAIAVALAWPEDAVPGGLPGPEAESSRPPPARLLTAAGGPVREPSDPTLARTATRPGEEPGLQEAVVTVLGCGEEVRVGVPVRVLSLRHGTRTRHLLTNKEGQVSLGKITLDGSVRVEALDRWIPTPAASGPRAMRILASAAILEVETTLHCSSNMALDVRLEDAVSGQRLADIPYSAARDGDDKVATGLLPGARVRVGIQFPARHLSSTGHLDAHVVWDRSAWKTTISRYAGRLAMVYPLRRQARVEVYAQEHDGTPTDRALIEGFYLAGRTIYSDTPSTPHRGGFLVRDIPFLRDEALQVLVVRPPQPVSEDDEDVEIEEECCIEEELDSDLVADDWSCAGVYAGAALGKGRLPHEWRERLIITAVFPEDAQEEVLFGGSGAMWFSSGCGCSSSRKGPLGRVVVTVIRRSGEPAVGAYVRIDGVRARTDLRGRATLEGVRVGTRELGLSEPGLVATTRQVVVLADRTQRVTLREAAGATVKIQVVDESGDGLPYATLEFPKWSGWVDLQAGVQRIDPYTDREGRRTLRHFPAGEWTLEASYGSRKGEVKIDLKHGAVRTVTITLK